MNEKTQLYIRCLEKALSDKYQIHKDESSKMIKFPYVVSTLIELSKYPEIKLDDYIEKVADNI